MRCIVNRRCSMDCIDLAFNAATSTEMLIKHIGEVVMRVVRIGSNGSESMIKRNSSSPSLANLMVTVGNNIGLLAVVNTPPFRGLE